MGLRDLNRADLWFTVDGDYLIDGAGDLKDTSDSGTLFEGVRQAILHRVICETNGWRINPNLCAGLERFIGKTIDQNLLEGIQLAIHRVLTGDGSLTREDYMIRVVELTPSIVAILIYANLPGQENPLVSMSWSIQSGGITRIL